MLRDISCFNITRAFWNSSEFAIHNNFSKFSSFVLKLRDRISVILFFSETKHLLVRIDPEVHTYWSKSIFQLLYFVVSFQNTQILRVRERMRCKQSAIFFQTLHILPRILGSMCKCKKYIPLFTTHFSLYEYYSFISHLNFLLSQVLQNVEKQVNFKTITKRPN